MTTSASQNPLDAFASPLMMPPVFHESLAGALIDSARISVTAAMALLPPPDERLIVLPGAAERIPNVEEAAATVHGCLEEAAMWLDQARGHATDALTAKGVPVTSLHVVGGGR